MSPFRQRNPNTAFTRLAAPLSQPRGVFLGRADGPTFAHKPAPIFALLATYLPVGLVLSTRGSFHRLGTVLGALVITTAVVVVRKAPWHRLPPWTAVVPALMHLGAIAILRHSVEASNALLSATVLLPVIGVSLRGNRGQIGAVLVGIAAVFDLPVLVLDDAKYGTSDVGHGFVLLVVGGAIGMALARSADRLHRVEDKLISTENRFQSIFESSPIGIALVDHDGVVVTANEAYGQLFGIDTNQPLRLVDLVHPEEAADVQDALTSIFSGAVARTETRRRIGTDGSERAVEVRKSLIRGAGGEPEFILLQVVDVTERERLSAQLQFQANHDPLTGLLNRRGFGNELSRHVSLAERYRASGALLMLDLDGFKHVNDSLGHAAGDALLIGIAEALRRRLRDTDVVARLGGDEFAVITPSTTHEQALTVAEAIVGTVGEVSAGTGEETLHVTASVGLVLFNERLTSEAMLYEADLAMYRAKELGKNRVVVAVPSTFTAPVPNGHAPGQPAGRTWSEHVTQWLDSEEQPLDADESVESVTTIDLRFPEQASVRTT